MAINIFAYKAVSILGVLLYSCASLNQHSIGIKESVIINQLSDLLAGSNGNLKSESYSLVVRNEGNNRALNLYADKAVSFLSTIQSILQFGEDARDLNYSFYDIDLLLRNREVLEELLAHPEYLKNVIEGYPRGYFEDPDAELRLLTIIPMSEEQYILGFLTLDGITDREHVYFLFSMENGIAESPLYFVFNDSGDTPLIEQINPESASVSGHPIYTPDEENEYLYFLLGSVGQGYYSLRYSIDNDQLMLEEQITAARRQRQNDAGVFPYSIVQYLRQGERLVKTSAIECPSPISTSDTVDGTSLLEACERNKLAKE